MKRLCSYEKLGSILKRISKTKEITIGDGEPITDYLWMVIRAQREALRGGVIPMTALESAISDLSQILNEGFGIETVEDTLFEIIEMIRNDEALKARFLDMVEQSFSNRDPSGLFENGVPRELIELATHELRWPEFARLANVRVDALFGGDEGLAISDVARGVKRAYADDWEDREFFHRYAV